MPESTLNEPGTKEYFREKAADFRQMMKFKAFWEDLSTAKAAKEYLEQIWADTVDAEICDGSTMKEVRLEYEVHYRHAVYCVLEAKKHLPEEANHGA